MLIQQFHILAQLLMVTVDRENVLMPTKIFWSVRKTVVRK